MLPSTHANEFRKMFENIKWEGGGGENGGGGGGGIEAIPPWQNFI